MLCILNMHRICYIIFTNMHDNISHKIQRYLNQKNMKNIISKYICHGVIKNSCGIRSKLDQRKINSAYYGNKEKRKTTIPQSMNVIHCLYGI